MTLDARTQALLDLVEADRERRCREILDTARRRAAMTVQQAHEEARTRMHIAFTEERARTGARIASAQANLQTRRRLDLQQRTAALLAAGWRMLPDALLRRWADPGHRAAWIAGVVAAARAALPRGRWRISHPADWPAAEREALAAALTGELGTAPEMIAASAIRAGLRIAADGNVVDGTQEGLTSDRDETGARLLHFLEQGATLK
jgi:hypothetical protein